MLLDRSSDSVGLLPPPPRENQKYEKSTFFQKCNKSAYMDFQVSLTAPQREN